MQQVHLVLLPCPRLQEVVPLPVYKAPEEVLLVTEVSSRGDVWLCVRVSVSRYYVSSTTWQPSQRPPKVASSLPSSEAGPVSPSSAVGGAGKQGVGKVGKQEVEGPPPTKDQQRTQLKRKAKVWEI